MSWESWESNPSTQSKGNSEKLRIKLQIKMRCFKSNDQEQNVLKSVKIYWINSTVSEFKDTHISEIFEIINHQLLGSLCTCKGVRWWMQTYPLDKAAGCDSWLWTPRLSAERTSKWERREGQCFPFLPSWRWCWWWRWKCRKCLITFCLPDNGEDDDGDCDSSS